MRTLSVLISVSNETTDKDGIIMQNVKFSWLDGKPISLNFENLCVIGIKTLFRKRDVVNGPINIVMKDVVNLDEPVLRINNIRGRRFYMTTENDKAYFWLCNGIKTDLNFHVKEEEPAVLDWLSAPREGEMKWFDLIAY